MTLCYLGLGSNLKSPQRQLAFAIRRLQKLPRVLVSRRSGFYLTEPQGLKAQPRYCNAVVEIHTNLPPLSLLKSCQNIERIQQRLRKKRWGARTIDIDILLYGNQQIRHHQLTIPHPAMWQRDFVIIPLQELRQNTAALTERMTPPTVCTARKLPV